MAVEEANPRPTREFTPASERVGLSQVRERASAPAGCVRGPAAEVIGSPSVRSPVLFSPRPLDPELSLARSPGSPAPPTETGWGKTDKGSVPMSRKQEVFTRLLYCHLDCFDS